MTPPRRALAADVPSLAALYVDCARRLGPRVYSREQVDAWARFGEDRAAFGAYVLGAETWLIDDASGPLGFCGVGPGPAPDVGEVRSLYVRADRHGQGLGSGLLAHALTSARARGVGRFGAWATPFGRPVFERAGFVLVEVRREDFQGVGFDRLRLALD
ncbi:MAG: GNAT family N-acetyltransferase [Rubrivivax sp.]|jgi:putative acetyltransferase|nr:GNAT family N-acetyltransferase [Rubrivivax sp.]